MQKAVVCSLCVGVVAVASPAFASHPHQQICLVTSAAPDANGLTMAFVLQVEVSREYVKGNPDEDVHDYRYQVRICDDDNDSASCSTYQSATVTHAGTDEVTLVGMKNKATVFFRGRFTDDNRMEGKIIEPRWNRPKRTFAPFSAKLDSCIGQSWVKLTPEVNSHMY